MSRIFYLIIVLSLLYTSVWAQDPPFPPPPDLVAWSKDSIKPYQKYPTLPSFNIRLLDSVTIFNTDNIPSGKPIAIVFFDPNCKHCQHSINALIKSMDSVRNVRFYFITPVHDLALLRNFYMQYHMGDYKNIQIAGRDFEFFFFDFYRTISYPDVALYDKHKKLIRLIEGEFSASDIYNCINGIKN